MVVRVEMVVMGRETEEVLVKMEICNGGGDVVEDGEVVTRIVARMVVRDVTGVEGASPRLRMVADLGEDGVEVVWWKGLLVVVVLEKVKEMVKIWWCFGFCSGINGDGGGKR